MRTGLALSLGFVLLSLHHWVEAEANETPYVTDINLHMTSCGWDLELDKDGRVTLQHGAESSSREVFCNTVLRISIPRGYGLMPNQRAELAVRAELSHAGDKLYLIFKSQSADAVDKVFKAVTLSLETPQKTHMALSGEALLPVVGSCDKDRETFLAFATTVRVGKANQQASSQIRLDRLSIPPMKLTALDCSPAARF